MDVDPSQSLFFLTALQQGDLRKVEEMLKSGTVQANAAIEITSGQQRTPLQVVSDWPGYFPNAPAMVALLIKAGADPNAPHSAGNPTERPLHWAASSDDVEVGAALLDGGADIECPGSSIRGGTPLDNAVAYGCWHMARLLLSRGARVERLWLAAALGWSARVQELLATEPKPDAQAINQAFWHACSGGQRRVAEDLLRLGAELTFIPPYSKSSCLDAAGEADTRRSLLVGWLHERGAISAKSGKPA